MVPDALAGSIGSTGFKVLRTRFISPSWLAYRVQASDFISAMSMKVQGALYPAVRPSDIEQFLIDIPPRLEQDRIVAEIEKQFPRLDAATAALRRVQANLKRYRASVLKAACEGRLVPMTEVSGGYKKVSVESLLGEPLANGRSPQSTRDGFKILRLTAIKDGHINVNEWRRGPATLRWIENLSIKRGDILISRGNGSISLVGLAGLVDEAISESEPVLFPDTMIRARLDNSVCDSRFFVLMWNSRVVRDQIEGTARTTAGIHKISQSDIERFQIPIPPIQDQLAIVAKTERTLTTLHHANQALQKLEARSSSLRTSILSHAFSGKLVQHCPSDEPASALLERIRAVRFSTPARKLTRRSRQEQGHT